jgi:hypothetical protein
MITSELVVAYLPEVAFPPYYPHRPLKLKATQATDAIVLTRKRQIGTADATNWRTLMLITLLGRCRSANY